MHGQERSLGGNGQIDGAADGSHRRWQARRVLGVGLARDLPRLAALDADREVAAAYRVAGAVSPQLACQVTQLVVVDGHADVETQGGNLHLVVVLVHVSIRPDSP
jgi:hypothetical protein